MKRIRSFLLALCALALPLRAAVIDPGAFAYTASFTVSGYAGSAPLSDFPVLVRLSATSPSGFDYAACAADGSDLRFSDADGNLIPHEIEAWDTAGESLVWVKLPEMDAGTTFSMWYGGADAAADATGTWSAYTGVWHMDEASGSVADATGHGLTASPQGNTANSVAIAGAVGNGRQTATSAAKGYLSVPNYDSFGLGDTFTMSGWVKLTACTAYPRIFSRKANYTDANGWEMEMNNGSLVNFAARGANNPSYSGTFPTALNAAWSHVVLVYSGTTLTVYQNGAQVKTGSITAATDNGLALSFGCDSDGSETYAQGAFDECRLLGGAASADWVKAEYDTASSASFLTVGASEPTVNPSFFASVTKLGADGFAAVATVGGVGMGASSCDLYFAYGPSGDPLPAYERVATGLVAGGTYSRNVTGLQEDAEYAWSFLISNNVDRTATRSGTITPGIGFKRPDPDVAEFSRGVKFAVAGYAGTEELTNFPVLVRLSNNSPSGFTYADFYNPGDVPGADLCFLDAAGNAIPHEIDTWNTSGESLVWVTLPRMRNGTEFAMWYRSSKSGAAIDGGANAWEDYTGVWHLGEGGDGAQYVYDSTTNALTGVTHANSLAVSVGRIGAARRNSTKSGNSAANGRILVSLGDANSPERAAVDALVPEFSASLWFSPKANADWSFLLARKGDDTLEGWGIQFGHNTDFQPVRIWASLGKNDGAYYRTFSPGSPYNNLSGMNQVAWRKVNVVYGADGYVDYYYDGGAYHTRQQVPLCGKNFDSNLSEILARNGSADLAIGGMSASGYGSFNGEMDEVRLRRGKDSADWVKAEYDAVVDAAFLTGGEVVTFLETPRPIATLALSDSSAKYAQFSGSIGLCGGDATACDVLVKVWKTAESEPAEWTVLAAALAEGAAFTKAVTGLDPETAYSYKIKAVNNLETPVDSEIAEGTFTTGGTGAGGTGGERYRVGNDYVHVFEVDPETGANAFEFTPPSYLSSVQALVVAGGGPGGYRRGGGGGAGGLIHDTALAVTGGSTYTVTVGAGGVATESAAAYGTSGGASSISLGQIVLVETSGGGAGGNADNASYRPGAAGGSGGGGGGIAGTAGGAGTAGQGNAGGQGNANNNNAVAGGGGGAGRAGGSGSGDSPPSGGSGGQGYRCSITGSDVWYAGGGGGGGVQTGSANNLGSPGGGGDGGGGRGGMAVPNGTVNPAFDEHAIAGTDGLGGGGGGGSDVNGSYQGANGGSGVVIVRYTVQGTGAGSAEPVVSLTGATYAGDLRITGSWRVAWAGEGANDADVYIKWGYAANSLTHSVNVAQDAVGTGTFEIAVPVDQTTIYLRAMADNGTAQGLSDEIVPIHIPEYEGVVPGDPTIPVLGTVSLASVDGVFARVAGSVTSFGTAGEGEDPITGCEVYALVGTSANVSRMTEQDPMPVAAGEPFSLAISNLTVGVTYYWCVEARNSAGVAIATDVGSFTTLGASAMNAATTGANQRNVSVSGSLATVGAGTTTILARWNDGGWSEWETVATFAPGAASTAFTATHLASGWGNVGWELMCSNECATAEGVPTGQAWTSTQSGTVQPADKAVYTWRPVDGDWNGAWNDPAHWSCNSDDGRGYPQTSTATASFANCTLASPVTVSVPGQYTVGTLVFFGADPASVTFAGQGASTSRLNVSTLPDNCAKENAVLEFRDMTLNRSSNGVWTPSKNDAGPTNFTFRLSGATLSNVSELTIASPYATVEFLDGSTATFSNKMSIGGTNTVVTIDDSTVNAKAIYIPADADGPGMKVRLRGTTPLLKQNTTDGAFATWAQSWSTVFEFQVPTNGYAAAPIQMLSTSYKFGQAHNDDKSAATPTFGFAVADDSPALFVNEAITNNVLVQTANGFYVDRMADPLGTVPSFRGVEGDFEYGLAGAEEADASAARQILLDLTGSAAAPRTFLLIW